MVPKRTSPFCHETLGPFDLSDQGYLDSQRLSTKMRNETKDARKRKISEIFTECPEISSSYATMNPCHHQIHHQGHPQRPIKDGSLPSTITIRTFPPMQHQASGHFETGSSLPLEVDASSLFYNCRGVTWVRCTQLTPNCVGVEEIIRRASSGRPRLWSNGISSSERNVTATLDFNNTEHDGRSRVISIGSSSPKLQPQPPPCFPEGMPLSAPPRLPPKGCIV